MHGAPSTTDGVPNVDASNKQGGVWSAVGQRDALMPSAGHRRCQDLDVAGGAFTIRHVLVEGDWCNLVLFAPDRPHFLAAAKELDLGLPRGWRQTRPEPRLDHTCGRDELVHLLPLDSASFYAGPLSALTRMMATASIDPKRAMTWQRIEQAAQAADEVVPCQVNRV